MDKSKFLRPDQLFNSESAKEHLDKFLKFKDDPNFLCLSDDEKQRFMNEKIDEQLNILGEVNFKAACNLGTLEWLDDRHEACFTRFKDKPQFMGRTSGGKTYLNNEETLFMIETNNAICYFKSLQLSLQDSFDLMIRNEQEFERYMVYSYLLKFGFRVKRRDSNGNANCFKGASSSKSNSVNKRSIGLDEVDVQPIKKVKVYKQSAIKRDQIEPISVYLLNDASISDEDDDLKFMRFLRFQKLCENRYSNWDDLLDDFNKVTLNSKVDTKSVENDENSAQFQTDFFEDSSKSLIHFNELLSENEIQDRLTSNGPQLDLDDYSLDDLVNDDYDYDVYLPNKRQRVQDTKPDYYLKIIHKTQNPSFPVDEIFKLNSKYMVDKKKLLFAFCQSNEINFYQFTDVDLFRDSVLS